MLPKQRHWFALLPALTLLSLTAPAFVADARAAGQGVPVVHGRILRDQARITFEWPEPVKLTARQEGKKVTLRFARPAKPDFSALLSALYPYVTKAELGSGGHTVVLTTDQPYPIRTFLSGKVSGLELLELNQKAKAAQTPPAPSKKASATQPVPKTVAKPSAKHEKALAALAPAAGGEVTPKPEPASTPAAAPEPSATTDQQKATAPAGDVPEKESAAATETTATPPATPFTMTVERKENLVTFHFPWQERVAAAAFARGGYAWIVFNKPAAPPLDEATAASPPVVGAMTQMPHTSATVLRIPIEPDTAVEVAREEKSFAWSVSLRSGNTARQKAGISVDVNTEPPQRPHLFLPALEVAEPLTLSDPAIGDELIVVPFFQPGESIFPARSFVEFALLATSQGMAVQKISDDVHVALLRNGLRVSTRGKEGPSLTPNLPDPELAEAATSGSGKQGTLFPYADWKAEKPENFERELRGLYRQIALAPDTQEANRLRLRAAQMLLSEGLAPETLGMLANIQRSDPEFFTAEKLIAMQGAAQFLMHRYKDALADFSAPELQGIAEIDYWRNMTSELVGDPKDNFDYLASHNDYIRHYPPRFRQRLAIVAADRSVGGGDYTGAMKTFDTLSADKLLEPVGNYANYLLAKIAAEGGQSQAALDIWQKQAEDYKDPFVRARADFSMIPEQLKLGTITRDEAVKRLERLSVAWRGDTLELSVLTLLGDFYAEKQDYPAAMKVWKDVLAHFPDYAQASEAAKKLGEAFVFLFNKGGAEGLPALDALALYYEFRDFTPAGEEGTSILRNLVDRLIKMDLLDQAAAMLDHQVRFRLEKEERSRAGARLAAIHLLNRKPEEAMRALQFSVYGDNPRELRVKREQLAAHALVEMKQYDKALELVAAHEGDEADRLRMEVLWRKKDWPALVDLTEAVLKRRKDIAAQVTPQEGEFLLRLAVAYRFQENDIQIQYLRDYFLPLMEKNPHRPVFDFLTRPEAPPTPENFADTLQQLADTKTFLENYRAAVSTP